MSLVMLLRLLVTCVTIINAVPHNNNDSKLKIEGLNKVNADKNLTSTKSTNITTGKLNVTKIQIKKNRDVLNKCCPIGQAIVNYVSCNNSKHSFNPRVYEETPTRNFQEIEEFNVTYKFNITIGVINETVCGNTRIPLLRNKFQILKNGSLYDMAKTNVHLYGSDKYCIDNFMQDPSANESSVELKAVICFLKNKVENNFALTSSCMLISCFFIILTVGVYAWLPELRNLHGMVLMAYLLSFFVGFSFLTAMQILHLWNQNTSNMCTGFTFVIYYSLLIAFFWMNVMCYDIWWTFSGTRALSDPGKSSVLSRFLAYSLYAFGVPTALTVLLAVLEFTIDPELSVYLPRIRKQGCFLYGLSKLIYFYTPILALCVSNLALFTLTTVKIAEIKRQTLVLHQKDKQRFSLYIKLFILMGVNWILEVISSFYPDFDKVWKFTDAYNVLVGLIIFIIFVCKKKTWAMIKHRYKHLMGQSLSRTQTKSTAISTHASCKDEAQPNSTNSIKK